MNRTLRHLHQQEDGQVMLLALITAIFLVLVMAFPLNVGWTISKRLRLQNAADAAAYSAAVVQSDGLSAIAWLNNAQSWCYQRQYGLELKFCTYGTYALLEQWGDEKGAQKPGNNDYDLDGEAWYQDFKNKVNNKPPVDAFNEFMNGEARLINRQRNSCAAQDRTLEAWTRMLRVVAEEIAKQLPDMMRYEAMRIAYLNTYDGTVKNDKEQNQVYMAFFPDDDTSPVRLDFTPNPHASQYSGEVATDNSFMQYEKWHNKYEMGSDGLGCRFVERAMQIAADQNQFYMNPSNGKLNTLELGDHHIIDGFGKVNMGSIDTKDTAWYNEYDGEPRKKDGMYVWFAKTAICWHQKDKQGHKEKDKTPCGHWHPDHTHLHFNCQHYDITVYTFKFHFHIPFPSLPGHDDEKGWNENYWCILGERKNKCSQWYAPPPGCGCLGIADVQGAVAKGAAAAQEVLDKCAALVQEKQAAYDADQSDANSDALKEAQKQLQNAQEKLQPVLDATKLTTNAMGMNPIMETRVNLSVIPTSDIHEPVIDAPSPNKGSGEESWWHHGIHYCDLCFTKSDGINREFPASAAATYHGLAYRKAVPFTANHSQRADHYFSVTEQLDNVVQPVKGKKKSMVRAFIEDLLSYSDAFDDNWPKFKREAAFHQILKSNYSPEQPAPPAGQIQAKLCPTIIFKPVHDASDPHNFFNWGITVALWQKHHSIMFRRYTAAEGGGGVFSEMEGMLAIASAKVGIRVQSKLYGNTSSRKGAAHYFPERLICGIGEKSRPGEPSGPYNAAYMHQRFLINRDRKEPILNLFHTDWGARLIPIQKSVPEAESKHAAKFVLAQTRHLYCYDGADKKPRVVPESIASAKRAGIDVQGWTDSEWAFLTRLLVH